MFVNRVAGRGAAAVVIGAVVVAVSGIGAAVASNSGVVLLGVHNSATSVTTLSNSKGAALALKSKHGTPPLTVNSGKIVKHLNASMVGGSTASQLKTSGSGAATTYTLGTEGTVGLEPTAIATTGKLKKGTYYATATATMDVGTGESGLCTMLTTKPGVADTQPYQSATQGFGTATDSRPISVAAGQKITEYCWVTGGSITGLLGAGGITAIRVDAATKGSVIVGHPVV